jgi:hypothetical protein
MPRRTDPDWYEYRLTEAGLDLFPAILTLKAWAERHLLEPKDTRLQIRHSACSAELTPLVVCESCRAPVHASEVEYKATKDRVGPQIRGERQ